MRRRRPARPSITIGSPDPDRLSAFFEAIGWSAADGVITTPGGRFAIERRDLPPRLELALSVPDVLLVDELAEIVDDAGGIVMEPLQETVGGWGFSFNDPDGNTWEIGSPWTVTLVDRVLSGARPPTNCPIVALSVPRRPRLPETV